MDVASYVISLVGPAEPVTVTADASDTTVSIGSIEEGDWLITVDGYNSAGTAIASGSQSVYVSAGQATTATIEVVPTRGQGTIDLEITWPASAVAAPSVDAVLTVDGGSSDTLPFVVDTSGDPAVATYSGTWDDGYYSLALNLLDGTTSVWGRMEAVRVIEGESSTGTFALSEEGMNLVDSGAVEVNLIPNLQNPYELALTGAQGSVGTNQDMTVAVTLDPAETPDTIQWYVNGEPQVGAQSESVTIGPSGIVLAEGNYWLDVLVTKSSISSSAGMVFTVTPPPIGSRKWEVNVGNQVNSNPAVASDGTIYVGCDDGHVYALDSDGTVKWSYATGSYVRSSPSVGADGTVYVASSDGHLYALNPDGTLNWTCLTSSTENASPAIGPDGTIYVGAGDLFAVNPDGTVKWQYDSGSGVFDSSPAVASDGTVYIGSLDTKLYAVDSSGALSWTYATNDVIRSSPAVGSDGTVYVGSTDGFVYAIDPQGALLWTFDTGDVVHSNPSIGSDGVVYVGGNRLYALNPDGTEKWSLAPGVSAYTSPVVLSSGDVLYAGWSAVVVVDSLGTQRWSFDAGATIVSSPTVGQDGTVYFGCTDGTVRALYSDSGAVSDGPWPMFHQNPNQTGLQP
jgi:outer membrane protein assembly factor BamB